MAAVKSQYYSGFDPRQLSNCQLWLDGADRSYFTFSSGSNITIWKDKSGNAYDASAVGVPTRAAGPTGLTGVVFNGTSKFIGTQANTGTVMTGFVVADMSSTAASDARIVSLAASGTSDFGSASHTALFLRNGTAQQVRTFRNNASLGTRNIVYNTPFVGTSLFTGASNLVYSNGAPATPVASSGNFGYTQYGLGNYPSYPTSSGSQPLTGTIYEVILYNQALSSNDRQAVEGYLAWKWNLNTSLLSNHAYRRAPAVMRPLGPPDLGSNTALWVDAADYTTFDFDTSGLVVGDPISNWIDKSGNNRHLTRGLNPPYYISDPVSVEFGPAVGPSLDISDANNLAVGRTFSVFTVESRSSNIASNYWIGGIGTTANSNLFMGYLSDTSAVLGFTSNDLRVSISSYATNSNVRVWTMEYNGSSRTIYINGTSVATAANVTNLAAWPGAAMGRYANPFTVSSYYQGNIREVVWSTPSLSAFQRQQVEGYLAWKWNRQGDLPVGHPFKTYYPLVPTTNPLIVSNCALWLDAADTATITTSGTNVTTWADKSGNARNATATSNWPTFTAGNNYIQFSGNNWFSYPATFLVSTQYTLFFSVARDVSKAEHILTSSGSGNTNNRNLITGYSPNMTTFKYGYFGNDTQFTTPTPTSLPEAPTIITLQQTATQRLAWYNGSQLLTNANSTLLLAQNDGLLGVYFRSASTAWNGKWYEVLMYNRALTATERRQIEGYLAWKWGVNGNLVRGHPYKTLRP